MTCGTPYRRLPTSATMRFVLSNCVTAAMTSQSSTPAFTSVSSSKPRPCTVEPLKLRPRFANASAFLSMTHTLLPLSDSMFANCEPTRPQPTTITLLIPILSPSARAPISCRALAYCKPRARESGETRP